MEKEPTIREVLEAINAFASHMQELWRKSDERFHRIDVKLEKMDATLDKVVSQTMEIQEWRAEVAPKLARL